MNVFLLSLILIFLSSCKQTQKSTEATSAHFNDSIIEKSSLVASSNTTQVIAPSGCAITLTSTGNIMKTTDKKLLKAVCSKGTSLVYRWKKADTTIGTTQSLELTNPSPGLHTYSVRISNTLSSKTVTKEIVVLTTSPTEYLASPSPSDKIWVGPRALEENIGSSGHRNILSDYHEIYTQPNNWNEVASNSQVFDLFQEALMVMKLDSPASMNSLAQSIKLRKLKVNIETGGLRPSANEQCGTASANLEFENEKAIFSYWKSMANGSAPLDYLTTDNAIFFSMNKRYGGANPCRLSLSQVVDLYITNAVKMKSAFPGISIGLTEGLGAFNLIGLDGTQYVSTDPDNINLNFEELIKLITSKAKKNGIKIDYFVIDYADSVSYDASHYPSSLYISEGNDYGRILAAEAIAKKYGLRVGLFANWIKAKSALEAKTKSIDFRRQYTQVGGKADFYNFEFWQSIPDKLGTESDEQSNVWNTLRDLIRDLKNISNQACSALNFRGGSVSKSNLNIGEDFLMSCDYGVVDSFIYPKVQGSQCSFLGISGTVANFKCPAPMNSGNYQVDCIHARNASMKTCAAKNALGTITVTDSCTKLPLKAGTVSTRTVSPSGSFSITCDYGQMDNFTYPSAQGSTCQFNGHSGTAAKFTCTASATPGSYAVGCIHAGNLEAKICSQNNSLGVINVN